MINRVVTGLQNLIYYDIKDRFLLKIQFIKNKKEKMGVKKALGEKIKRLRKQRNLTQEQLAEMIDIAPRNLSKIEVGANFVTAETIEKLIAALNITTEELFANDYIKDNKELLSGIYTKIDKIKNESKKLEIVYKMLDFIINF